MQLQSGIYTMDVVTVAPGETLEGVGRVIITRADGTPPSVEIGAGAVLRNVWIGGTRQTQNNAGMYLLDDATTFFCAVCNKSKSFILVLSTPTTPLGTLFISSLS